MCPCAHPTYTRYQQITGQPVYKSNRGQCPKKQIQVSVKEINRYWLIKKPAQVLTETGTSVEVWFIRVNTTDLVSGNQFLSPFFIYQRRINKFIKKKCFLKTKDISPQMVINFLWSRHSNEAVILSTINLYNYIVLNQPMHQLTTLIPPPTPLNPWGSL